MKFLLLILLLLTTGCNSTEVQNNTQGADETEQSIVEENDMCICTKDWRPVCGSDGITYPNACQAGCSKIKKFTQGPCNLKEDSKK